MNPLKEMERLIARSQRPGVFRRDQEGNEQALTGYLVTLTYRKQQRGQEPCTMQAQLVVLAPSRQAALTIATKPYQDSTVVIECREHHLSNPTLLCLEKPQ